MARCPDVLTDKLHPQFVYGKAFEIFRKFKEGLEVKKTVLKQHQTVFAPKGAPQVGGELFGVSLSIFNFNSNLKTISNLPNLLFTSILLML